MAKSHRPKQPTKHTKMTIDESTVADADAAVASVEDAPEAFDAQPAEEEPQVTLPPPAAEPPPAAVIVPKDVLRGVFNTRTIDAIAQDAWDRAIEAVKAGRLVKLVGGAPHLVVTDIAFDASAPLPPGVTSPVSVLNNLVAGML